jgi:hypothetical protein
MDTDKALGFLRERLTELGELQAVDTPQYQDWRQKTERTLKRIFGPRHDFVTDFESIEFDSLSDNPTWIKRVFESARTQTEALLKGAIYELEVLSEPTEFASATSVDPELWEHVRHLVEQEQWAQVASQTAIFVEDKVRQWAGRPDGETTTHLMTAVLKPVGGVFPLGRTDPEAEGWHQLGRGFMGAVRNVATHRIERRDDAKRWALGVLGVGSLLLTQPRHQHANSFRS